MKLCFKRQQIGTYTNKGSLIGVREMVMEKNVKGAMEKTDNK